MIKWIAFTAGAIAALLSATNAHAAFNDVWEKSACRGNIELFGSGVPMFVQRLRLAGGKAASDGVIVEMGSPNDDLAKDTSWRQIVPLLEGGPIATMNAVTTAGWIAFKKQGAERFWSEIYLDEGGNCRRMGDISMPRAVAPGLVRDYFASTAGQLVSKPSQTSADQEEDFYIPEEPKVALGINDPEILFGEQLSAYVKSLPAPILKQLLKAQEDCKAEGNQDAAIDDHFVAKLDVDGDGDDDYITSGDHLYCVTNDNKHVMRGGNHATPVSIVLSTSRGFATAFSDLIGGGQMHRYNGFGVFEISVDGQARYKLIRRGKLQDVEGLPKGGETVYTIAR